MIKLNKKVMIVTSILTVLPVLAGIIFWNSLPDVMATHFGMDNAANGFSGKAFTVFGIPFILLGLHWFCIIVTLKDPKRQNIGPKIFGLILWIVPAVSILCAISIYSYNLGIKFDISAVAEIPLAVMFILVGNYLPKTRQNYTIGIKIPWTLADEDNWNRTHRFAGGIWMAGGGILLILIAAHICGTAWIIGIALVLAIVPCIYSFILHVKKDGEDGL